METPNAATGNGQSAPAAPQGQAAPAAPQSATPSTPAPTGQADAGKAPNLEGADNWEYDGNLNAVPPQFQKFAKGLQRHFTQRSMTEAEIRRKGQEYDQFVASEDFKRFQQWRQQQVSGQGQPQVAPQGQQPANPTIINAQEWEDAQLDPTGQKAQGLIDRVVQARLNQAVQVYGGQLQQLQQAQEKTRFDNALSSFADANPDVLELHETGLMKPLLQEEMASGKHKTYEAAIHAAYQRSAQARDNIKAALMAEQQKLAAQKKDAIVMNSAATGSSDVIYVDKNDAFSTAFENAMSGKKVKNKLK
jgi:hypothetical protein